MSQRERSSRTQTRTQASTQGPSQASSSQAGPSQHSQTSRTQTQSGSTATQKPAIEFGLFGPFHQAILSVFISQSIMNGQQVHKMFQETCAACEVPFPADTKSYMNAVATTMSVINVRIKKYQLAIKKVCADASIDSYYCLVNKSSHNQYQQQEVYSKKELEYLMELVKEILDSGRGYVTAREAGHVVTVPKLTQSGVEDLLEKFVFLKLIVHDTEKGRVWLGPRALAELEPYLRHKFPDAVSKCSFCQGIITVLGIKCEGCPGRCHPSCLARLIDPQANAASIQLHCSHCQTPFLRETIEKYRSWALKQCEVIAVDKEMEVDRQARIEEIAPQAAGAAARKDATADTTMEYD